MRLLNTVRYTAADLEKAISIFATDPTIFSGFARRVPHEITSYMAWHSSDFSVPFPKGTRVVTARVSRIYASVVISFYRVVDPSDDGVGLLGRDRGVMIFEVIDYSGSCEVKAYDNAGFRSLVHDDTDLPVGDFSFRPPCIEDARKTAKKIEDRRRIVDQHAIRSEAILFE